jgi:integrase/recombinase XerD
MLTIYRRHLKSCPHRDEGRKFRRCQCPVWVDGFLGDVEMRKSLRTKNWEKAQRIVRDWEANAEEPPKIDPQPSPILLPDACETFLKDAAARNLRESTLKKYRLLFRQLQSFATQRGFRFIKEFDLTAVREFRTTWPNRNLGALKKLEYLRAFFRFAQESGWIEDNPASKIKNPRVSHCPTMPFSHDEMIRILRACDEYGQKFQGERRAQENARRARALVLLLRYSGLRITDAVGLARNRIVNNKLFLYTAKTGAPVYCPLPEFTLSALEAVPRTNERYFFWSGESKIESAVTNWQNALRAIFLLAGVIKGHAHRFRDTFAVQLLLASVPIERVSVLLGHASVRITEKHYAPWVRERQAQLEEDIQRSWERDPLLKGTPEVHGEKELVI